MYMFFLFVLLAFFSRWTPNYTSINITSTCLISWRKKWFPFISKMTRVAWKRAPSMRIRVTTSWTPSKRMFTHLSRRLVLPLPPPPYASIPVIIYIAIHFQWRCEKLPTVHIVMLVKFQRRQKLHIALRMFTVRFSVFFNKIISTSTVQYIDCASVKNRVRVRVRVRVPEMLYYICTYILLYITIM